MSRPQAATRTQLLAIGLSALLLRVAVFAVTISGGKFSVLAYTDAGDGKSYQAYAAAICGDRTQWTQYDKRVFPGYPALIAAAHGVTQLSLGICALLVTWISAAVAAAGSAMLFNDRRVGWAMVALIPHWPINSSLAMSEAPMLALTVCGLICGSGGMSAAAGALLGMAVTIRPVACFPLAGLLLAQCLSERKNQAIVAAGMAGMVILGGLQWVHWLTGDPFSNVKVYAHSSAAYGGRIFAWPFQALIQTPLRAHPPIVFLAYIWAYVALVLAGCVALIRRVRLQHRPDRLEQIALIWLAGNTLFTLCIGSGPYGWGFYHFPRFTIPATPALFWAFGRALPSSTVVWVCVTVLMFAIAAMGVHQALVAGPMPALFGE
jgi:hypothetical protein